ncbi:MAG: hypothetical protein QXY20_07025 [Thermofilum sp.]|uniref:hypothetical protein n=1 Tax=Thermofilum sp. TaxID=1961369 RepID=UPI003160B68F
MFNKLFYKGRMWIGDIGKLPQNTKVTLIGLASSVGVDSYRKKSGGEFKVLHFDLCDKTGCVLAELFDPSDEDFKNIVDGAELMINGKVVDWRGVRRVSVSSYEVYRNVLEEFKDAVENNVSEGALSDDPKPQTESERARQDDPRAILVATLQRIESDGKKARYDRFLKLLEKLKLSEDDVKDIVEVYEERSPDSLETVKYVRLKKNNGVGVK